MPDLPADVRLQHEGDSTRLLLPPRPRTAPPWVGLLPIAFGMIFTSIGIYLVLDALELFGRPPAEIPPDFNAGPEAIEPVPPPPPEPWRFNPWNIIPALFGLPFFLAGLVPMFAGVLLFFQSHAEILITPTHLVGMDRAGPFRFSRRRPLAAITGIRVSRAIQHGKQGASPPSHGIFADCNATPASPPLPLAQRYPRTLLTAIAYTLVEEIARHRAVATLAAGAPAGRATSLAVTVDEEPGPVPLPPDLESHPAPTPPPEQPQDSTITFIPTPDSLTFMVPKAGFRSPTPAFFLLFSLFWNGITFCVATGFVVSLVQDPSLDDLLALGFISIFVAIGVGMALAAVQTALRKSVLLATRDSLVFTQTGPIRNVEHHWTPAELASIRVGNSGTKVNNRPLEQLQVHATRNNSPEHQGMLTGRDPHELHWIAGTLRSFYALRG